MEVWENENLHSKEISCMLAISIKTIQKLVRDKQMVAYRIGGRYLIKESDLIDCIQNK